MFAEVEAIEIIFGKSNKWENRLSRDDPKVCETRDNEHGRIISFTKYTGFV